MLGAPSILTTLRWHNVWTEPGERWWSPAAWSLPQGTRSCCRASTGWSAGCSDPSYTGAGCTTHRVSVWKRAWQWGEGEERSSDRDSYSSRRAGLSILTEQSSGDRERTNRREKRRYRQAANSSKSQLCTKSPWLPQEKEPTCFISSPHVLPA